MRSILAFVAVFVGGGIGSMLRHAVGLASLAIVGPPFPIGTLLINVVGSFVMGLLAGWLALKGNIDQSLRLFLMTGVLGGFTTYSTFSLETALLWERGAIGLMAVYVGGTLFFGWVGVFGGLAVTRMIG